MRFINADVFVYAVIKLKIYLTESEKRIKSSAKRIVERVDKRKKVIMSIPNTCSPQKT